MQIKSGQATNPSDTADTGVTWILYVLYSVAEQKEGEGGHLYRCGNFARKCISTTSIGKLIYIWSRAAIPPAPALVLS